MFENVADTGDLESNTEADHKDVAVLHIILDVP